MRFLPPLPALPSAPVLAPHPRFPSSTPADLPSGALNTLVATGVFLVLIAIAGCLGIKYNNKVGGRYLLGCYAGLMVLVMIMEFAASIAIFSFVGVLDHVAPTTALDVRCLPSPIGP